jgi:hypothetical protein
VLAVVLAVAAMIPSLRPAGWSPTVLPRVDAHTQMGAAARRIDPGFELVSQGAYDGQFYWGIAVDPIAAGDVHQAFDTASYRYGHPLYGWVGWLLSAGQARAAAAALAVAGLLALFAAAAAAAALGRAGGLFVAANPGLLYAAAHDLGETLSAALLLGGLLAYARGRRAAMLACFAFLPLAKENLIVVPLAVAAWELWQRRHVLAVLPVIATVVPSAVWWIYARVTLGAWFTTGDTALGVPFSGWKRALLDAGIHSYSLAPDQNQLGQATVVVLVGLLGLLAVAAVRSLRLRSPVELAFLALAAIAACLAPIATVLLRDALRNTAVVVVLVPLVLARRPLLPATVRARDSEAASG